jgi:hypothetical protein
MNSLLLTLSLWSLQAEPVAEWQIQRIDQEPIQVEQLKLIPNGKWQCGPQLELNVDQVISIRNLKRPLPAYPTKAHLRFRNGDYWVGHLVEGDQRFLQIRLGSPDSPIQKVPVSRVDTIQLQPTKIILSSGGIRNDQFYLRNGDTLQGTYLSTSASKGVVLVQTEGKERTLSLDQLAALKMNAELGTNRPLEQLHWRVLLVDGSRISLTNLQVDQERIIGSTPFKNEIQLNIQDVVSIETVSPKIVFTIQMKLVRFDYNPFLSETRSWEIDRSLDQKQLSTRRGTEIDFHDRGFSLPSRSTLTIPLNGDYVWFLTEVSVDPELGKRGSVQLSIRVDGKEIDLKDAKKLTATSEPHSLRIALKDAKQMDFQVNWGDGGPIGDVVNWCGARWIRK